MTRLFWLLVAALLALAAAPGEAPRKIVLNDPDAWYCVRDPKGGALSCAPLVTLRARLLSPDCADTR